MRATKLRGLAESMLLGSEFAAFAIMAVGAVSIVSDPRPTFELLVDISSSPAASTAALVLLVATETAIAAAILTRRLRGWLAVLVTACLLAIFSGWLVLALGEVGSDRECGCLSWIRTASVGDALAGNLIVLGELLFALALRVVLTLADR